jgi:cell division protein FtsQ
MNRQYRLVPRSKPEKAPFPSLASVLALVVIVMCAYGFFRFTKYMITDSQMFLLKDIKVENNHYLDEQDIIRLAGIQMGVKLFQISKTAVIEKILENPYLEGVSVGRSIPSTLIISVQERQPVAYLVDQKIYMVDPEGKILLQKEGMQLQNLPLITGFTVNELLKDRNPLFQALQLIEFITDVNPGIFQFISEIHLSKTGPAELFLIRGSARVELGKSKIYEKIYLLGELIKRTEVLNELKDIKRIDLSYNNKVFITRKN